MALPFCSPILRDRQRPFHGISIVVFRGFSVEFLGRASEAGLSNAGRKYTEEASATPAADAPVFSLDLGRFWDCSRLSVLLPDVANLLLLRHQSLLSGL
jgi:hypothetical protein